MAELHQARADLEREKAESARLQETAAIRAAEIVKQRDDALTKCDENYAACTSANERCDQALAEASKLSLASSQAEFWQAGEIKRLTAERNAAQKAHADAEKRIGELEDQLKRHQAGETRRAALIGEIADDLQRTLNKIN